MTSGIEVSIEGRLGVIALDRPQAINALTVEMVQGIAAQLTAWRDDPAVRAVLFEGRGPKGFCSGGDVRWVRGEVLAGRSEQGFAFFAEEYGMNGQIAGYGKPVVALADGIVMGGGIGIAGHADFRFATSAARFAMPESAIGFVCDIGVNGILARAPVHRALAFELSGMAVGAADGLALGLTDCVIPPERMGEVRKAIVAAAGADDIETTLVGIMQGEGVDAGEAVFCAEADLLDDEMLGETAAEILEDVAEAAKSEPRVKKIAEMMATRSPSSLEAILQGHLAARRLGDLDAILALDLRLARLMARRPDFAEGVRAVLVDRDRTPKWGAEIPAAEIAAEVRAVEEAEARR